MTNRFFAGQTNFIEELNALDGESGDAQQAIDDHIADTTGAHAASAISNTPAGNIAATTVQAAINELDSEKLSASATTLPASFTASSLTSVGTLTALTVSGTSTLGVTRASAADGAITFGVAGTTRGVRIFTSSYGTAIEGVDNTLGASYQPLNIVASALGLYTTGGSAIALGTSSGTPQMYVTNTTSAVNYATITGSATGNAVAYGVAGTDANIGLSVNTKGTGSHFFRTNGGAQTQFVVSHTASAVNYLQATGSTTGNEVRLSVQGTDTNAGMWLTTKGNGVIRMETGGGEQFRVAHTASAVNCFSVTGSAVGGFSNILESIGTDANIQNLYASKGTYGHMFRTNGSGGQTQFLIAHAPSAVNYYQVQGAATAGAPVFFATGSDVNVSAIYSLKGAGNHVFYTATTTAPQLIVAHTASAANYLQVTGSATGNAVTISTGGSDANRRIAVTAGGTEGVLLGNATNGSIVGIGSYSGAEKTIYILNTTAAPTSNPPGGGYLYCEGGALKYRGSAGTVTTIAAA